MKRTCGSEPVQVYRDAAERGLGRLARQLGATESDVVRRGPAALEREALDPDRHPALQIIGLAGRERPRGSRYDVARQHDRYLAESEEASRGREPRQRLRRRG